MQWNDGTIASLWKQILEQADGRREGGHDCTRPGYLSGRRVCCIHMKKEPIHQNLNTSFVSVRALVRYLRGLQFVGSIRIEWSSYEADIIFTGSGTIRAREFDHIAGRIAHGEHVLERILERAREPHGRIHVYKAIEGYAGHDEGAVFIDKSIVAGARSLAANSGGNVGRANYEFILSGHESESALVLGELSELLRVIDEILAKGRLSFPAAFGNACDAIAPNFPFMNDSSLRYKNGEIVLNGSADASSVASAVFAALRPIFERLRREIKYESLLRLLTERLREIASRKRSEYVRLSLMHHVEELLEGDA
jgi:hypothetical protein